MFSPQIVKSEEFLSMPVSSQALYFHLGMDADDDGFVQPKIIMRSLGSNDDDLRILVAKRFLLAFETGVVVIKHWLIHNLIQKDRYHPTRFQDEKRTLFVKENKAYTDALPSVNSLLPEVRLGKDRLVKSIPAPEAPFVLEEKLEQMEKNPNSHLDVIASFIREKELKIENGKQLSAVIKRYARAAKEIAGAYSTEQIYAAVDKIKKDNDRRKRQNGDVVDWTLETVLKMLTK